MSRAFATLFLALSPAQLRPRWLPPSPHTPRLHFREEVLFGEWGEGLNGRDTPAFPAGFLQCLPRPVGGAPALPSPPTRVQLAILSVPRGVGSRKQKTIKFSCIHTVRRGKLRPRG